jgi:hypothetical protein
VIELKQKCYCRTPYQGGALPLSYGSNINNLAWFRQAILHLSCTSAREKITPAEAGVKFAFGREDIGQSDRVGKMQRQLSPAADMSWYTA